MGNKGVGKTKMINCVTTELASCNEPLIKPLVDFAFTNGFVIGLICGFFLAIVFIYWLGLFEHFNRGVKQK